MKIAFNNSKVYSNKRQKRKKTRVSTDLYIAFYKRCES